MGSKGYKNPNVIFFESRGNVTARVHQVLDKYLVDTFLVNGGRYSSFSNADTPRFDDPKEAVVYAKQFLNEQNEK